MGTARSACGTPGEHHCMVSSPMTEGLLQPWSILKAPPGGSGSTCSSIQSQRLAVRDAHSPCAISAVPCLSNDAVSYCQHLFMPDLETLSSSVSLKLCSQATKCVMTFHRDVALLARQLTPFGLWATQQPGKSRGSGERLAPPMPSW